MNLFSSPRQDHFTDGHTHRLPPDCVFRLCRTLIPRLGRDCNRKGNATRGRRAPPPFQSPGSAARIGSDERRRPSRCPRYRTDRLLSAVLRKDPAGPAAERSLGVYLPPGYEDELQRRYPVVYFLHGYGHGRRAPDDRLEGRPQAQPPVPGPAAGGGDPEAPAGSSRPWTSHPGRGARPRSSWCSRTAACRFPSCTARACRTAPRRPRAASTSTPRTQGASPPTCSRRWSDHVDRRYRTRAERSGRSLAGGSMGGYGALLGGILHPGRFQAVAALSPAVSLLDLLGVELVVPYLKLLLGEKRARERGRRDLDDILDTADRVFSADRPLRPGGTDPLARENWARAGLERLAERDPRRAAGGAGAAQLRGERRVRLRRRHPPAARGRCCGWAWSTPSRSTATRWPPATRRTPSASPGASCRPCASAWRGRRAASVRAGPPRAAAAPGTSAPSRPGPRSPAAAAGPAPPSAGRCSAPSGRP